jgi:hypothetical protein
MPDPSVNGGSAIAVECCRAREGGVNSREVTRLEPVEPGAGSNARRVRPLLPRLDDESWIVAACSPREQKCERADGYRALDAIHDAGERDLTRFA